MQRLSLAEWDAERLRIMDDLPEEKAENWRLIESHRRMREQHGPRPKDDRMSDESTRPLNGHTNGHTKWVVRIVSAALVGALAYIVVTDREDFRADSQQTDLNTAEIRVVNQRWTERFDAMLATLQRMETKMDQHHDEHHHTAAGGNP